MGVLFLLFIFKTEGIDSIKSGGCFILSFIWGILGASLALNNN